MYAVVACLCILSCIYTYITENLSSDVLVWVSLLLSKECTLLLLSLIIFSLNLSIWQPVVMDFTPWCSGSSTSSIPNCCKQSSTSLFSLSSKFSVSVRSCAL